jgi:hypothetical protein
MDFLCEDLPQHGVLLVAPTSVEYDSLLADIQRRQEHPVDDPPPMWKQLLPRVLEQDRATSAILLNRNSKAIAGVQAVWTFETASGRSYRHSTGMLQPQLLLGQGQLSEHLTYWQTILPGSKRYVSESGMVGDNTDVRPPSREESRSGMGAVGGGVRGGRGRGGPVQREPLKQVTLTLDGVFFLDGEFAGPNREMLFERTVAQAEARRLVERIAREGSAAGLSAAQILVEVEKAAGPLPEQPPMLHELRDPSATPEEFRQRALQQLAWQFLMPIRVVRGGAETEAELPNFRKA